MEAADEELGCRCGDGEHRHDENRANRLEARHRRQARGDKEAGRDEADRQPRGAGSGRVKGGEHELLPAEGRRDNEDDKDGRRGQQRPRHLEPKDRDGVEGNELEDPVEDTPRIDVDP